MEAREHQALALSQYGPVDLTTAQSFRVLTPPQVGAFPHGIQEGGRMGVCNLPSWLQNWQCLM